MKDLSTYDELINILDNLPLLVKEKRRRLGISQRELGRIINIAYSTISRFEGGEQMHITTIRPLLEWISVND